MARVLITGGTGFLGTNVARQLLMAGHAVVLFDSHPDHTTRDGLTDRLRAHRLSDIQEHLAIETGDTRAPALRAAMEAHRTDLVVHLAAVSDSRDSLIDPEEASTVDLHGLLNVLEAVRSLDVKRFVFASSSSVYGRSPEEPTGEDHPLDPVDSRGRSKQTGETLTRAFCGESDVEWVVLRLSSLYGFGDGSRRVTRIFLENGLRGWPLRIFDGGRDRADFTDVEDAARGVVQAAFHERAAGQTFNLAHGESRTIRELARIVQQHFPNADIEDHPERRLQARAGHGQLDITRATASFGYTPATSLEEGIDRYASQWKECASWLDLQGAPSPTFFT